MKHKIALHRLETICRCGRGKYQGYNPVYCCTPANTSCEKVGFGQHANCFEGDVLPWGTFCPHQAQCPISVASDTAIISRCNNDDHPHCPRNGKTSKICMESVKPRPIESYCSEGKKCPSANRGMAFEQCYNP